MKNLKKILFSLNFYSLSIFFVFAGSCLIFIPPIISVDGLQALMEKIYPFASSQTTEVFLNFMQAIGIEFYGGAMISFAFGVVDERNEASKLERENQHNERLFLEIERLSKELRDLNETVSMISKDISTRSGFLLSVVRIIRAFRNKVMGKNK